MKCPYCESENIFNKETHNMPDGSVKRIKLCTNCGVSFITYEYYVPNAKELCSARQTKRKETINKKISEGLKK